MGKKKEKEVKTEIKNDTVTQGNVKITLIKGGKKAGQIVTHNTGTIDLCEYIAQALTGDYVIARRPGIVVPFTKGTDGKPIPIGNGSPYVSSKLGASASYWDSESHKDADGNDGGFCTAEITFLIPSAIVSGSTINGFQLLSKDNSRKVYATVELPGEGLTPQGDTNIKIEWTLYVSYKWEIDRSL